MILFSNRVHNSILYDYQWCLKNLHLFCQLDSELFFAIYGKKKDGVIVINEKEFLE